MVAAGGGRCWYMACAGIAALSRALRTGSGPALFASVATDFVGQSADGFRALMHLATGSRVLATAVWWIMAAGLLLVWVGTKLLIDLWPCRLSSASLGLAARCYAAAVLVRLAWPSPHDALRPIMLQQGAAMSGHVFVLLAMGLYASGMLILDTRGLLPHFPAIRMR